jgi:hypothetical protein
MGLSSEVTGGSGPFGGLPQYKKAKQMTADKAVACGPRKCERWERSRPVVWTNRGSPKKWQF